MISLLCQHIKRLQQLSDWSKPAPSNPSVWACLDRSGRASSRWLAKPSLSVTSSPLRTGRPVKRWQSPDPGGEESTFDSPARIKSVAALLPKKHEDLALEDVEITESL